MIRLLARERASLAGDAEALAAVRRGLVTRVKHFAWHYVDRGQRVRASRVFLAGFALTGAPGLFARALAVWLPWSLVTRSARPAQISGSRRCRATRAIRPGRRARVRRRRPRSAA